MLRFLAALVLVSALASCSGASERGIAAVAMPDRFGAEAAVDILAAGGNAVDATVAAGLVLAVTYPEAGNIGGGGFMTLLFEGQPTFLDYRETAPAAAARDMYLDNAGNVIEDLSLIGHQAIGVPGTVAGLWEAHQRYGVLPWKDVVAPAISLAEDGFRVPADLAKRIRRSADTFAGRTNFADYFGSVRSRRTFRQPELADLLKRIAAAGKSGFYGGRTAELIVAEMNRGGGLITRSDLESYTAVWRKPIVSPWREYTIVSAPLPSSGGFAVVQLLGMKDSLAQEFKGLNHNSAQYVHVIAEMEKRVFADRAEYLGDPDFIDVDIGLLVSDDYIGQRAKEVKRDSISQLDEVRPGLKEPTDTAHFSIVDRWGNAVANTYTLNGWFGSGVIVEGAGFLLNNQMDDFSAKPGVPNYYGVVGDTANAIEPGKRMLSSMSPTILLHDDEPVMVLGTPGGSTIFTSVFQAIVNVIDFDMSPEEAVEATRFHHQLLPPEKITYSPCCPLSRGTIRELEEKGYSPQPHSYEYGDLQVLWNDGTGWQAASDPRHRGESRVIN